MVFVRVVCILSFLCCKATEIALTVPLLGRLFNVLLSFCASIIRLGAGNYCASGLDDRPERHNKSSTVGIDLYEYEGCPFCRKVREALTVLDLDYNCYPCPRETFKQYGFFQKSRFRPVVQEKGGKLVFPFLIDNNTGVSMYDSSNIVKYLWKEYGLGARPHTSDKLGNAPIFRIGTFLATAFRPLPKMGILRTPSKQPKEPVVLYNVEGSPYSRIAREALCTLELPYVCRNCAHGALRNRIDFQKRHEGRWVFKIPLLIDPNTGVTMTESSDIVTYVNALGSLIYSLLSNIFFHYASCTAWLLR